MMAPIYAEPGASLSDAVVKELTDRAMKHNSDDRKQAQERRLKILKSKHHELIAEQVLLVYESDEIKEQIAKFVRTTVNPAADIVDNVCAVWKHGAVRRVMGASDDEQEALHKLVRETRFDARAPWWNQLGYFVGPVLLLPTMRGEKLCVDAAEPHTFDVVLDRTDPLGAPVGAGVQISDPGDAGTGANLMIVDAHARRFFTRKKATREWIELEDMRDEHGLGRFPGTVLRFEDPESDDWYVCGRHQRLIEGSADVGRVYAAMSFVRKTQNKWLLSVIGNTKSISKGSNLSETEKPQISMTTRVGGDKRETRAETHDFNTDPVTFFREIRFSSESMSESTGVRATVAVDLDRIGLEFDYEQLSEVRLRQIEWARGSECDFWSIAVPLARMARHRLAPKLPEKDLEHTLQAEYPPLSRRFADPEKEMAWWDWMFKHGLASVVDLARRQLPASDKELWARIKKNIKESGVLWQLMAEQNAGAAPANDGTARTLPQMNGAMGPQVRDSNPSQGGTQEAAQQ